MSILSRPQFVKIIAYIQDHHLAGIILMIPDLVYIKPIWPSIPQDIEGNICTRFKGEAQILF